MNSTIKMSRIHLLIDSKCLMVLRCLYIVQGAHCALQSATTAYHRESGTIKGIVGIIHCRLIELTDRMDQNISPIDTIG